MVASGPATISGSQVTITGVGAVMLGASQAASGNDAGATATTSFTVGQATPTLTLALIATKATFSATAVGGSTDTLTWTAVGGARWVPDLYASEQL
ncbi:MAG: hypothetical protein ACRYFU_05460 [Janthinobacterium lividum]